MKRVVQWFSGLSRKGKAATITAVFFVLTGAIGSLGDNQPSSNVQESGLIEVKQSENKELEDKIQKIDEQKAAQEQTEQQKQAEEAQPAQTTTPQTTAPAQTQSQPKATSKPATTTAPARTPAAQTPTQTPQPTEASPPASQPTQEQPPAVAPPPPPAPPASTSNDSSIVHITDTGSKYHSAGCQYLSKSDITVTLTQATASGLTPCSKCGPPQ